MEIEGGVTEFMCRQAVEGDEEEDEDQVTSSSGRRAKGEINANMEDDEEEEEDEEGDESDGIIEGLIDDNSVDQEGSIKGGDVSRKKRKRKDDELSDQLEDDDYDLLEENLGIKVSRKRKFKRVRKIVDDDSDDDCPIRGREAIANELFQGSDNEDLPSLPDHDPVPLQVGDEESEDSDEDDFIVDDEGRPVHESRRTRPIYSDAAVQEAQDIFGVDFDYLEFDASGKDRDEIDDEDEANESERRKPTRKPRKIQELFEPYELEKAGLSDTAKKIRDTDLPERMQLRTVPVTKADDNELDEEAEWIYNLAFSTRLPKKEKIQAVETITVPSRDAKAPVIEETGGGDWADDWDKQTGVQEPTTTLSFPVPARTALNMANANDSDEENDIVWKNRGIDFASEINRKTSQQQQPTQQNDAQDNNNSFSEGNNNWPVPEAGGTRGRGGGGRGRGGGGRGGGSRACFRCNQEGHISRDCPNPNSSNNNGNGRGRGGGFGTGVCYNCHETGHFARECPSAPGGGIGRGRGRGRGSGRGGFGGRYNNNAESDNWGSSQTESASHNQSAADENWDDNEVGGGTETAFPQPASVLRQQQTIDDDENWDDPPTRVPPPEPVQNNPPAQDTSWENWDTESSVSLARPGPTQSKSQPIPAPPQSDHWEDWDNESVLRPSNPLSNKKPTTQVCSNAVDMDEDWEDEPSGKNIISQVDGAGGWDDEDWDNDPPNQCTSVPSVANVPDPNIPHNDDWDDVQNDSRSQISQSSRDEDGFRKPFAPSSYRGRGSNRGRGGGFGGSGRGKGGGYGSSTDTWNSKNANYQPLGNRVVTPRTVTQVEENWDDEEVAAITTSSSLSTSNSAASKNNNPANNWDDDDWGDGITTLKNTPTHAVPMAETNSKNNTGDENWDEPEPPVRVEKVMRTTVEVPVAGDGWDNWDAQTTFPGPAQSTVSVAPPPSSVAQGNRVDEDADWDESGDVAKSQYGKSSKKKEKRKPTEEEKHLIMSKIRVALENMRNNNFEVPYVALYKNASIYPDLDPHDLWNIYRLDAQFCQLRSRKQGLLGLFESMMQYLQERAEGISASAENTVLEAVRPITPEDIDMVKKIKTSEEYHDVYTFFTLHYRDEIEGMRKFFALKKQASTSVSRSHDEVDDAAVAEQILNEDQDTIAENNEETENGEYKKKKKVKRVGSGGSYGVCKKFGILQFLPCYGITADSLANNFKEDYMFHEINQVQISPIDAAKEICSDRVKTPDEVIKGAQLMMSTQIARHPIVRRVVRNVFFERAVISCCPTKKGLVEIDEGHPCFSMMYLKNKPQDTFKPLQFLKLVLAEKLDLLTITIGDEIPGRTGEKSYFEEVKEFFQRDEFGQNAQDWNALRAECLQIAFQTILYPSLRKELKEKLLQEDKKIILKSCTNKLHNWINVAPYKVPENAAREDIEWNTDCGVRVLSLAFSSDIEQVSYACFLTARGEVNDYVKLPNITKRASRTDGEIIQKKASDLISIKAMMTKYKPHVVVIGGESREALGIQKEVKELVNELVAEANFPNIAVEIIDNQVAKVYSASNKGKADFPSFPTLLKEAISLGRRMQDPLLEFCQLCNTDDDILCVRFHQLQDQVPKAELLEHLQHELIIKTNLIGVDINRAVEHWHTSSVVQFVCGLGPHKALGILKALKQRNLKLEGRYQLLEYKLVGSNIFYNCGGFIKIDVKAVSQNTENYIEVLDGTRIHPMSYDLAKKIAIDATHEDGQRDKDSHTALELVMASPALVHNLHIDALENEDQKSAAKNIVAELTRPFSEERAAYKTPEINELFHILTKETPQTLYIGKLTTATVAGVVFKKTEASENDAAQPVKMPTGRWQCTFCRQNNFLEVNDVWKHLDLNECPGVVIGIRLLLENGISGFINTDRLSDDQVRHPEDRVKKGQVIHCRIIGINPERFSVECTCRSSDLMDTRGTWRPEKDYYYDKEKEEFDLNKEKQKLADTKMKPKPQTLLQGILVHPSFKKVNHVEAEKLLAPADQGTAIVRPSSRGGNHLALTWKVTEGIFQHFNVVTQKKEEAASKHAFYIGTEEFDDLDEIITRHVMPMASNAREVIENKYYLESLNGVREKADKHLKELQKANSRKIHYAFHPSPEYPGKFLISYLPSGRSKHEFFTVTPDGFRFRQQMFETLSSMLIWFKMHYNDPPPQLLPSYTPHTVFTPSAAQAYQQRVVARTCPPPPTRSAMAAIPSSSFSVAASHVTTPHYKTPAPDFTPYSSIPHLTPHNNANAPVLRR